MNKYDLSDLNVSDSEILMQIAKRRGFIVKGGGYDFDRTATGIILDFRKQAFGKIILEKYEDKR